MPEKIRTSGRSLAAAGGTTLGGPARHRPTIRSERQVREQLVRRKRVHFGSFTTYVAPAVSCGEVFGPLSRYAQMRRGPRARAFTCWVNRNGPGLTYVRSRVLLYLRAFSSDEVAAHRVDAFCDHTWTAWRGPSELPLTFSVYWWLMRTIVGVTVTNRLDADAGTAKTSRPTVMSNPTRRRVRRERPEAERDGGECMGTLPVAPPRPPEF